MTGPELKQLREDLGAPIGRRLSTADMAKILRAGAQERSRHLAQMGGRGGAERASGRATIAPASGQHQL
jgi:hypothetical protein